METSGKGYPDFVQAIKGVVAKIPQGKVATYGQVAQYAGHIGKAREVGRVMSRIGGAEDLPCHRVVNQKGTLAPEFVFGGEQIQRVLLESEGVQFLEDGRINMSRSLWSEDEQISLF